MRMQTGKTAKEGKHIMRSALCATCHTLTTTAFHPDGSVAGGWAVPSLEKPATWRHSGSLAEVGRGQPEGDNEKS